MGSKIVAYIAPSRDVPQRGMRDECGHQHVVRVRVLSNLRASGCALPLRRYEARLCRIGFDGEAVRKHEVLQGRR